MAEIFLGRREGAEGFERPVVIKRILPHLAKDRSFVRMFLDEARITSALRHKNVIRVEELERENDDLYMVMEYLAGESLAELKRALRRRNKTLGPQLAAYLVAEACAGLHAAHTMKNKSGEPLSVVHRDISPQNLFLGYDGSIEVLDFGIAHARFRLTKTESGYVKGKFDYMSPEQVTNDGLDPRSDVFALGIVLYELLTGVRLFKRSNPAATINAVLTHEVEPPSALSEGVSGSIDSVCLKALARDREDRYESALSMREALLACLPPDGEARAAARLPKLMRLLFEQEIKAKTELLLRAETAEPPAADKEESLSGARAGSPTAPSAAELSDAPTAINPLPSRPERRPWPLAAGAAILLVGGVGATLALWPVALQVEITKAAPAPRSAPETPATAPRGQRTRPLRPPPQRELSVNTPRLTPLLLTPPLLTPLLLQNLHQP